MPTVQACWFDGQRNQRRWVAVQWLSGQLHLQADDEAPRCYALDSLSLGPRWQRGPLAVGLPDGGTLWLDHAQPGRNPVVDQLLAAASRPGRVERAVASVRVAVVALLCVVVLLVWLDRQGMGWVARGVVAALPRSVDVALGQRLFKVIDASSLVPSRSVSLARQQRLQSRWAAAGAQVAPRLSLTLYFRDQKDSSNAFNAFALPDGSVVVLDGLAQALSDDELMAVLGHELGHVVHRHGLRSVTQAVGLSVVSQLVLGDFSSWMASLASAWQVMHYSRDAERQADAFIPVFLSAAGLPSGTERAMWLKFKAEMDRRGLIGLADWMSTHPALEERIQTASQRQ